jgi:hypothetical protein
MAEPKTRRTGASVATFLATLDDPRQRADARTIAAMMRAATGAKAEMWGPSIVGFGTSMIRYADGTERPWPLIAFSPRKGALVLYLSATGYEEFGALLAEVGKVRTSKACLYVRRLADVDEGALRRLIEEAVRRLRSQS